LSKRHWVFDKGKGFGIKIKGCPRIQADETDSTDLPDPPESEDNLYPSDSRRLPSGRKLNDPGYGLVNSAIGNPSA
jgi:hypothetical protein